MLDFEGAEDMRGVFMRILLGGLKIHIVVVFFVLLAVNAGVGIAKHI